MTLNPFVKAGIGLSFALLWSCPTLAEMTAEKNFGLDVKITGQSEDDRDLGTRPGGDVNGLGLDLRPWVYGERGNWSAYAMGQAVAATDTIETDTLRQNDDGTSTETGDDSRQPDKSYLAMREFWVGYSGLTAYPGEQLRLGRQRLRSDDGMWRDTNIEALNWTFDTTLLKADLGVAQRFSEYRTDLTELAPEDKDRTHIYGNVATQWTPGHWVGVRAHHTHDSGSLKNPGETVDALDKTRTGDLTWLGLEANSDAYNWRNDHTVNYWGSVTWLTGDRDTLSSQAVGNEQVATGKQSGDVNAWATDLGIRLRLDPQWQVGAAYARGSGGGGDDGSKQPLQLHRHPLARAPLRRSLPRRAGQPAGGHPVRLVAAARRLRRQPDLPQVLACRRQPEHRLQRHQRGGQRQRREPPAGRWRKRPWPRDGRGRDQVLQARPAASFHEPGHRRTVRPGALACRCIQAGRRLRQGSGLVHAPRLRRCDLALLRPVGD